LKSKVYVQSGGFVLDRQRNAVGNSTGQDELLVDGNDLALRKSKLPNHDLHLQGKPLEDGKLPLA